MKLNNELILALKVDNKILVFFSLCFMSICNLMDYKRVKCLYIQESSPV